MSSSSSSISRKPNVSPISSTQPSAITNVNWADSSVTVNLTRETVKNSPRYESTEDLNRSHELEMYSHYGRPNYWEREHARETAPAELVD